MQLCVGRASARLENQVRSLRRVAETIGTLSNDDGDARDDIQLKIRLNFTFEFRICIDLFSAPIFLRIYST